MYQYQKDGYVITRMPGQTPKKHSYWISKAGNTDAYYCFSAADDQELDYQLRNGFDSYVRLYEQNHAQLISRDFTVTTPMGVLRVYAKHKTDCPADFPGVYVDWKASGDLLACVEYNPTNQAIQTCVYQPGQDAPTSVIVHEFDYADDEDTDHD